MALEVGGSIGIALAPAHGTDAATLMKRADIAMYEAKGGPGIGIYEAEDDDYSVRRLELAGALRRAIDDGELMVFYQPKARLSDGAIIGAEALVRWQHPEYGMLPPDDFISIAERSGLIGSLTNFVLRRAISQCRAWHAKGWDLSVAVNLSVVGLIDLDLPESIDGMLRVAGLDPKYLTLEITESSIMDTGRTVAAIDRLARIGVQLSIDDFGTGYSSLSYLQKLPVHEVKVDKSFTMSMSNNESDAAIVKSIVDLAHNLEPEGRRRGCRGRCVVAAARADGLRHRAGLLHEPPGPARAVRRVARGMARAPHRAVRPAARVTRRGCGAELTSARSPIHCRTDSSASVASSSRIAASARPASGGASRSARRTAQIARWTIHKPGNGGSWIQPSNHATSGSVSDGPSAATSAPGK